MKPLQLKVKGLNSFEEEQTIDFETLTAAGLFGIFGPTGSGKSTIVDAITLALYGEIARYDKTQGLRQFINTNAKEMSVAFRFALSGTVYAAERSYKLSGKTPTAVLARLYRPEDGAVLADKPRLMTEAVAERIGIGYEDFARAVVLPQGRFSDFLMLANKERRSMLERIFRLEKYGEALSKRARDWYVANKNALAILDSRLAQYEGVSEESLSALRQAQRALLESWERLKVETEQKIVEINALHEDVLLDAEIRQADAQAAVLHGQAEEMRTISDALEWAGRAAQALPFAEAWRATEVKRTESDTALRAAEEALRLAQAAEEIAQNQARAASAAREAALPEVLAAEAAAKQAIEQAREAAAVEAERQALLAEHQLQQQGLTHRREALEKARNERSEAQRQYEEGLRRNQAISVPAAYRRQVTEGRALAAKHTETTQTVELLQNREADLEKEIIRQKSQLEDLYQKAQAGEKDKAEQTARLETIRKTLMPDEALEEQRGRVFALEAELALHTQKRAQLQAFLGEMEACEALARQKKLAYDRLTEDVKRLSDLLAQCDARIGDFERASLAAKLYASLREGEPCPVCGGTDHPYRHAPGPVAAADTDISLTEERARLSHEGQEVQKAAAEAQAEMMAAEKRAAQLAPQIQALSEEGITLSDTEDRQRLYDAKQAWEKSAGLARQLREEIQKLEAALAEIAAKLHRLAVDKAATEQALAKDGEALALCRRELEQARTGAAALEGQLTAQKQALGVEDFAAEEERLRKVDAEITTWEAQEKTLREVLKRNDAAIERLSAEIGQDEQKTAAIVTSGKEKRLMYDRLYGYVRQAVGDGDPAAVWAERHAQAEALQKTAQEAGEKAELAAKERTVAQQVAAEAAQRNEGLMYLAGAQKQDWENALRSSGFSDEAALRAACLPEQETKEKRGALTAYEAQRRRNEEARAVLAEKSRGRDLSGALEKERQANEALKLLQEEITRHTEQAAVHKERLQRMTKDLTAAVALQDDKKKLETLQDGLEDITELLSGGRFVDYIARRQLAYVAEEASRRLKQMTGGRYALELDESDFIVRDDYNGGTRRWPRTLSGGEVFMVSLCLALALSSKIQLKNNAPLEFFFLDEGFGTLDPVSLDTVMDALERLVLEQRDRAVHIGLITHVLEVRSRLPVKLVVEPPRQGLHGSQVWLERD